MKQTLLLSCGLFALISICGPASGLGSKRKWQKLSYGAAMPLGELQEDMHMGEGLPIGPERELSRAVVRSIR